VRVPGTHFRKIPKTFLAVHGAWRYHNLWVRDLIEEDSTRRRWPINAARPIVVRRPPLKTGTDSRDEGWSRDDYRPDLLPKRQWKMSDLDWLAVPVKVAASINA
jgi:hypothetical protein